MKNLCAISICLAALFCSLAGCSLDSMRRSSSTRETSSGEVAVNASSDSTNKPAEDFDGPMGYTGASNPEPITGTNLVEVIISVRCVKTDMNDISCKSVRLSGKVKVNASAPLRFAGDTMASLGIASSSWEIESVPGLDCQTAPDGFQYNPKCSGSDSLATTIIRATLSLVGTDGSIHKGVSPNQGPMPSSASAGVFGNFMLLEPSPGFGPSGSQYPDASAGFTQIWQDLVSGQYLTNILFSGSSTDPRRLDWEKATSLCNSIDSGDGAGKWRLPSAVELCGPDYAYGPGSFTCGGGLSTHDIGIAPFAGGHWGGDNNVGYLWSSTSSSPSSGSKVWVVDPGRSHYSYFAWPTAAPYGVICVRK